MSALTTAKIETLITLAKVNQVNDDLSTHLNEVSYVPEELKAMFQEAEADSKKEAMRDAVDSIRTILSTSNDAKKMLVQTVRNYRQAEKAALSQLAEIDRALQYGAETMNYVPLVSVIGLIGIGTIGRIPAEKQSVPENWKPKAPAKKATAK